MCITVQIAKSLQDILTTGDDKCEQCWNKKKCSLLWVVFSLCTHGNVENEQQLVVSALELLLLNSIIFSLSLSYVMVATVRTSPTVVLFSSLLVAY